MTNFGAYPKRRVSFELNVAYESDCELVKKVVIDCMKSCDLVDLDPEPNCRLKVLGDSSITFFATCWCDSSDYWDTYYYCLDAIYNEFKRNNISIPYTQLEVRERKDEVVMPYREVGLKERVGKVHENKEKKVSLVDLDEVPLKDINKVIFKKNKKNKEAKNTDEKDKSSKKANTKETKN